MRKRREAYMKVVAAAMFSVCFIHVLHVYAEVSSETEDEIVITSETVYDMEQIDDPETVWNGEDGTVYKLKFWEIEELQEEARQERIRETVICRDIAGSEEAELFHPVSGTDERTGARVTADGRRVEMFPMGERWREGVKIPLICYLCREERNLPGGNPIIYNELEPPKEACREILRRMGITDEDYEISDITWEGEVFKSSDGYLCRMVRAEGRKRLRDYQVVYEGTVIYPEIRSYRSRAVYEPDQEEPESTEDRKQDELPEQSESEEDLSENSEINSRTSEEIRVERERKERQVRLIKETISITFTIGVPLILAAVLLWGISALRHKKK